MSEETICMEPYPAAPSSHNDAPNGDALASIQSSLDHLALLKAKVARLTAAAHEAERQIAHRVGVAYSSKDLGQEQVQEIARQYRQVSLPGYSKRWNDSGAPNWSLIHQWFPPNGPGDSWMGEWPLTPKASRPTGGVPVAYVLLGEDTNPCYVGSTSRFTSRLTCHERDGKRFTWWYAFRCTDRTAAYNLEARLLAEHMPHLNLRREGTRAA